MELVFLALLICYCGVAIPLEIAFEDDLVLEWCSPDMRITVDVQAREPSACSPNFYPACIP